jgi:hypothetical protein
VGSGPLRRRGRQWRADRIREGETVTGALNSLRASTGGGGSSQARWSEVRRLRVEDMAGEVVSKGGSPAGGVRRSGWLGPGATWIRLCMTVCCGAA